MFLHAWTYLVNITVILGTKTLTLSSYVIESQVSRPRDLVMFLHAWTYSVTIQYFWELLL
jgi:hypothetical protein